MQRRRKYEENQAIFSNAYFKTYLANFLKFGMPSCVYGGHKINKFYRNRTSSYRDMSVENGDLVVPVNNTIVCCTSFLTADTRPCVLICILSYTYLHAYCELLRSLTIAIAIYDSYCFLYSFSYSATLRGI